MRDRRVVRSSTGIRRVGIFRRFDLGLAMAQAYDGAPPYGQHRISKPLPGAMESRFINVGSVGCSGCHQTDDGLPAQWRPEAELLFRPDSRLRRAEDHRRDALGRSARRSDSGTTL